MQHIVLLQGEGQTLAYGPFDSPEAATAATERIEAKYEGRDVAFRLTVLTLLGI